MDYYQIARPAAHVAINRLAAFWLTPDERQDVIQAAAVGVWRSEQAGRTDRPYAFGAARREACKYIARLAAGHNPIHADELFDETEEFVGPSSSRSLPESITAQLWQLLFASRATHGRRGEDAVDTECAILYLVAAGYNNAGIAIQLGLTENTVKITRQRLRGKLTKLGATHDQI